LRGRKVSENLDYNRKIYLVNFEMETEDVLEFNIIQSYKR